MKNSNRILAGVCAMLFVLQTGMTGLTALAEEAPAATEAADVNAAAADVNAAAAETTEAAQPSQADEAAAATETAKAAETQQDAAEAQTETETTGVIAPVAAGDTMTATGVPTVPATLKIGTPVIVKGTVKSESSEITALTCGVYDENGKFVTGRTVAPRTKTYDLNRLDAYVAFNKLAVGNYTFAVIATNASNTNYAIVKQSFSVYDKVTPGTDASTDKITSTGITQIPDQIKKGSPVIVRGVVSSAQSDITQVTVSVTDPVGGGWLTGKTVDVNTKSYNIANLDSYVRFDKLPDGEFKFSVLVTNASNKQFEAYTKIFKVGTGNPVQQGDPASDTMTVVNLFQMPDSIKVGQIVNVTGTVFSKDTNFTALTVGVYDAQGNFKTGRTINPGTSIYDLKNLDRYVAFSKLAAGEYTLAIIASNGSKTNETLYSKKFTVGTGTVTPVTGEDKITLSGAANIQGAYKYGSPVNVYGTITSETTNLTSVTAGVYDANNKLITGSTVTVNAKSYDLKNLDRSVEFDKIPVGNDYTFRVYASNGTRTNEALYTSRIVVTADGTQPGTTVSDTLTLSGATSIPDSIKLGQPVNVTGTVISASSNMTALTVGVYNSDGQFVTGKTVNPRAKSYNLKNLDYAVTFDKLAAGTYTYAVIASNAANTNYTVLSKKFTVGTQNGTTPTDPPAAASLTITGGTEVPSNLAVGQLLNVKGTVQSSSTMTSLTVGVYDTSGHFKTGRTINPASKSYDLSKLDYAVEFNKLPKGSYVYAVIITNGEKTNYALVNKSFTVGGGTPATPVAGDDALAISGGTNVPDTIAYGRILNIFGTVTSGSSNMTSLTCGVYDAAGKFVTGRTINPNTRSYDLKRLDDYVAFNKLPAGEYTYAVIATNATHTNQTLVTKKFTVTGAAAVDASVTITGGTVVPSTVTRGRGVIVRGTVSSTQTISKVSVVVNDKNAQTNFTRTSGTATPNTKSYNLSALDSQVRFDLLPAGTYEYSVIVTSGGRNYTVTAQTFVVQ